MVTQTVPSTSACTNAQTPCPDSLPRGALSNTGPIIGGIVLAILGVAGCSDDDEVPAERCVAEALPLQNPRSFTLGETYYLPRISATDECPDNAAWAVLSAPLGSANQVYQTGAPEPRFTADVAGEYRFHIPAIDGAEHALTVVERSPAERFRNYYLTPLYGAARVGDELWTANGPSYTVTRLVDNAGTWSKAGEVVVGSWPAAIAWRAPMSHAVVALRGSDTVGFIDRERGVLEDALWVGDEPSGLAIAPDASRLYVSLATMGQVAVIDLASRDVLEWVSVGFDPRALVISADGARLFVASYRSGNRQKDLRGTYRADDERDVQIIDTDTLEITDHVTDVGMDLRAIALSEDGSELYVASTDGDPIPSQSDDQAIPFVHEVVVIGADPDVAGYATILRRADLTRQPGSQGPVVNPAGVAQSGNTVWVAAESSNVVVALNRATLAENARVEVCSGARQLIALDAGSAAVHCYQSFELWIVQADGQVVQKIALTDDPRPAEVALGDIVFTRPGEGYADNHSCSSCHVETQNDGVVWRFGPQIWHNVRPLQLLDATTPIEWGAYVSSTATFGYAGPASIVNRPATPQEAVGLEMFLGSLLGAPRRTGHTRLDGSYTEAALRGKALFEGKATCSGCHLPPLYTNRQFIAQGKSGEPADVPTLLGAYRHGVYFVAGQARNLERAVDVALQYVNVTLSPSETDDLLEFLYQLTPKGAHPLAIWPDIDSNDAVYPDVKPHVEFTEPVDSSQDRSAAQIAADFVVLEDKDGNRVASSIDVTGRRITLIPDTPLSAGAEYRFRVLKGLPFLHGGATEGERSTSFTVADPASGTLAESMTMTITVASPPPGPPTTDLPFLMNGITPGDDGLYFTFEPQLFETQQRQPLWARIDGDRFLMQPFALPIRPYSVANTFDVIGTVTEIGTDGTIERIEGTLRITGPGINIPGVPFVITRP
ncbi:MAG: hypothetical protein MJE77_01105 [Proteobacteria bacterium]|nr:hypothetical protein [Pseudomonadota bacterium]